MLQRDIFLNGEGDRYFARNAADQRMHSDDPVLKALTAIGFQASRALEIGASDGWRLLPLKQAGVYCAGVDPSASAVERGASFGLDLRCATCDDLPFETGSFDLVIFGFCLYLVDPELHFKCVSEADRVLRDGGVLAIYDFLPPRPYFNDYSHRPGVKSYKMEFSRYFLAGQSYSLIHRDMGSIKPPDERVGVDILLKDRRSAFHANPY